MEKLGWHSLGKGFDCECGMHHELPIEACHVGTDAAEALAKFAQGRCGERCLVVSDLNTRAAGGDKPLSMLGLVHKKIAEKVFPGDVEATEETAHETGLAGLDCDFYVAIGAGTVSDLAKSAGSRQNKPVLLYPTAASMNGYTSGIVALKVRGLKSTLPCQPATGVFADPEVAATAPQRMTAAGVADFLSKCSSASDWRAGHMLRGGYFCSRPREFNEGIQEQLFANAPAIGRGEPAGLKLVLDALLLSGFGMVVAGSSAPASGGEHLISHYLDMKHALYGVSNDLHGTQVGVATVYTLGLWERVLAMDTRAIDPAALADLHPSNETIRAWILEDWGPQVGEEVWKQWQQKAQGKKALRAEIERFRDLLPEMRAALSLDLQPAAIVARCIEESGGPTTPEGLTAPVEEFRNAQERSRFIRNRVTVLDIAAELGIV